MKKNDPRWKDTSVTPSCGNVFVDLGFEPAEAVVMLMRADLAINIEKIIKRKGWTKAEAAKQMGVSQLLVSKFLKSKMDDLTLDELLLMAGRLGRRYELKRAA